MKAHSLASQSTITPEKALEYLKEGNERFINNLKVNRNLLQQANDTREGQWPFAAILSCIDSRFKNYCSAGPYKVRGSKRSLRPRGNGQPDRTFIEDPTCRLSGNTHHSTR